MISSCTGWRGAPCSRWRFGLCIELRADAHGIPQTTREGRQWEIPSAAINKRVSSNEATSAEIASPKLNSKDRAQRPGGSMTANRSQYQLVSTKEAFRDPWPFAGHPEAVEVRRGRAKVCRNPAQNPLRCLGSSGVHPDEHTSAFRAGCIGGDSWRSLSKRNRSFGGMTSPSGAKDFEGPRAKRTKIGQRKSRP